MYCRFKVKGCNRCGGDLVLDEGDWRCWQCGQYYYVNSAASEGESRLETSGEQPADHEPQRPGAPSQSSQTDGAQSPKRKRQGGYGARAGRNINAVIRAKQTSDQRWWARNLHIIEHLDHGLSILEISRLVGRGQRQIRTVRERLTDLRAEANEENYP